MDIHHLFSSSEYEILEKLGEGGMGIVVKAKMRDQMVAIKVISPKVSKDREFQRRFLREMQVVSQLNHPNIVRAVDFGVDIEKDLYFVVLEFVDGQSLKNVLDKKGKIPVAIALQILKGVSLGLQHAYEHGVVHRDIKPDNIMLGRDNSIKITDFGLVKADQNPHTKDSLAKQNVTTKNVILGTPSYMAPERSQPSALLDIRSDIYSLGVTFYHMLAGRPPFVYDSSIRIIAAHSFETFPPIKDFVPDLPSSAEWLLDKMTRKKPEERFAIPKEIVDAIESLT